MSRFVSDLLILVAMILGVRLVAEADMDYSVAANILSAFAAPEFDLRLDLLSFALGVLAGLVVGFLASVRWTAVLERSRTWFARHSTRFSYIGLSLGFAIVLLYY